MNRAGIIGVGLALGPQVRGNDFWDPELVKTWPIPPQRELPADLTETQRRCLLALAEQQRDPYYGIETRSILPTSMSLLDLEVEAAEQAIARAGIDRDEIDLVIGSRTVPEYLLSNPAAPLHERLRLRRECLTTHVDTVGHAALHQLSLAEGMLLSGRARCALLVQSCAPSRLIDTTKPISAHFGDAATAMVVGRVESGGILGSVSYTDGRYPNTLVATVPGRPFYEEGRVTLHVGDPKQMQAVFLGVADACQTSIAAVLDRAGRRPGEVRFLAVHQGTTWMREIVQEHAGLTASRSVEMFRKTGYLFGCTLVAQLAAGEASGQLSRGDLVVLVAGGTGQTYGATALVW